MRQHEQQVEIVVPMPPDSLWPNRRLRWGGWRPAIRAKQQYQQDVRGAAYDALRQAGIATHVADKSLNGAPFRKARLSLVFRWPHGARMRDTDGCLGAMKSAIDALVQVGLLTNDSPAHLEIGGICHERVGGFAGSVVMVVEELRRQV